MIPNELKSMRPLQGDESLPREADYMGAIDIAAGTEPVLTIRNLYKGEITLSKGKEVKGVITFAEDRVPGINEVRPLVLNKTNWKTLKKLFGEVSAKLEGKQIQLYLQPGVRNPGTGEKGNGIRIREQIPDGKAYEPPKCEKCGKVIIGTSGFTPEQLFSASRQKYGKGLCIECGKKAKAAAEAEKEKEPQDDLAAQLMAAAGE